MTSTSHTNSPCGLHCFRPSKTILNPRQIRLPPNTSHTINPSPAANCYHTLCSKTVSAASIYSTISPRVISNRFSIKSTLKTTTITIQTTSGSGTSSNTHKPSTIRTNPLLLSICNGTPLRGSDSKPCIKPNKPSSIPLHHLQSNSDPHALLQRTPNPSTYTNKTNMTDILWMLIISKKQRRIQQT